MKNVLEYRNKNAATAGACDAAALAGGDVACCGDGAHGLACAAAHGDVAAASGGRAPMSRRGFLQLSVALGGAAVAASAVPGRAAAAPASATAYPTDPLAFCVMSDLHYFAPEIWSDCPDYTKAENSDRKMFRESRGILKKALADVVAAKPQLVLVPGDLTKDGELACHQGVHDLLMQAKRQLADAGVDTTFVVINGNHDLNNHHGMDFSSGSARPAHRADPLSYKELWADCSYEGVEPFDPSGTADGSLSYVARPCPGLTVIAVDTCKYNEASEDGSGPAQVTSGYVGERLLAWVCDRARAAHAAGDMVVAVQHHGIVPHFDDEPTMMGAYLVDNYDAVARAYAEAGISCVFTGHMHANDIAAATYGSATIYDIETGSLVTYPSYMRTGSVSFARDGANVTATLSVDVHDLGTVAFEGCGLDGQSQAITAYGQQRTLTVGSVQTMLSEMVVDPMLQDATATGSKAALAGLLAGLGVGDGSAEALDASLWTALTGSGLLPGTREEGIRLQVGPLAVSLYFDAALQQIRADKAPDDAAPGTRTLIVPLSAAQEAQLAPVAQALRVAAPRARMNYTYIDQASFAAFLDALFTSLDQQVLSDAARASVLAVVAEAVRLLLSAPVDGSHDVLALVDYAYQDHLLGCERQEPWADAAIAAIGEQGLLGQVVAQGVNGLLVAEPTKQLTASIPLAVETLLHKGDILGIGSLVPGVVAGMLPHVGALLALVAGDGSSEGMLDVGALVGGLLPASLAEFARSALYTLSHDTSVAEDHAFSLQGSMVDPLWRPSGGSGGTGGSGSGGTGGSGSAGSGGTGSGSGSGGGSTQGGSSSGGAGTTTPAPAPTPGGSPSTHAQSGQTPGGLPQTGDGIVTRVALPLLAGAGLVAAGFKSGFASRDDAE